MTYTKFWIHTDNIKALTINASTIKNYLYIAITLFCSESIKLKTECYDPRYDKHNNKSPDTIWDI